jgi:hypothetical protein
MVQLNDGGTYLWYVLWQVVEVLKQGIQRLLAQWELLLDLTVGFVP